MLGRYRLDAQVGQGGMAVVWRGWDTQLRRTVAIKVLHPHLHTRAEIRRRFDREAHAVARLHHPHILDVYDFSGPDAEPSYLITEFIPGLSLRAFAEAHPFDPPELAACCALPLVEALECAHAGGVVHRDVKPENVMVREDGQIKLTDFGIAALLDPDEKFTVTGSILGSPAHLAPETIDGKPADTRSDLFSLGTVLYWLACGKLPFHAPTPAALLRQILEGTPEDPRRVRPSVSDALARVIARLLERDPDQRYQTAAEVKRELSALLSTAGIDDPLAELRAFVKGTPPEAAGAALRTRLVARELGRGEQALKEKRTSAALAAFGRVLALEPRQPEARTRVDRIRTRARTILRARRALVACSVAVALGAGWQLVLRHRERVHAAEAEVARAQGLARDAVAATAANSRLATGTGLSGDPGTAAAARPPTGEPGGPPAMPAPDALAAADPRRTTDALPSPDGTGRKRPRGRDEGPARPLRVADVQTVPAVLMVHIVSAHVKVDNEDLGDGRSFARNLTVGLHRVTVSAICCADHNDTLNVTADQTRYTLEPGVPKPARLHIVGSPSPDLKVLVDGLPVGLVSNVAEHDVSTDAKPEHYVKVTVGSRSGTIKLQAGRDVAVDYIRQLTEGAQ